MDPLRSKGSKPARAPRRARPQVIPAPAAVPTTAIAPEALRLFPSEPGDQLREALALIRVYPMDAWFVKQRVRCRKACCRHGATHGPYYMAKWKRDGVLHMKYVGREERLREVLAAHDVVRAHLESQGIKAAAWSTRRKRRHRLTRTLSASDLRYELKRRDEARAREPDVGDEEDGQLAIPILEIGGKGRR